MRESCVELWLHWRSLVAALLLAVLASGVHAQAAAEVAIVVSAKGETRLVRPGALFSPLRAGVQVRAGDRLVTGGDGQLELKFTDNALVTLRAGTEFRVDDYKFDSSGQRSFLALTRGSLRSVSGLIGKRNRDDWRMTTPTAVIGIRGTEFDIAEVRCPEAGCPPGVVPGLAVAVVQGRVAVSTGAGSVEVPSGAALKIQDRQAVPTLALPSARSAVAAEAAGQWPAVAAVTPADAGRGGAPARVPPAAGTPGAAGPGAGSGAAGAGSPAAADSVPPPERNPGPFLY